MELTGKSTWTQWLRGVKSVADVQGLLPHIIEDSPNFVLPNPSCHASYPPVVHQWSTPQEWDVYMSWQQKDAVMMHILTSCLSQGVSASIPMIDDLECTGVVFTAQDMLARLWKLYGFGDHIQANAAREVLQSYMVDMCNILKYIKKWCNTILVLRAEQYPLVYTETVLNFVHNLPEDDCGWFMSIRQEVTHDCGINPGSIDYDYLVSIVSRMVDLDTQW